MKHYSYQMERRLTYLLSISSLVLLSVSGMAQSKEHYENRIESLQDDIKLKQDSIAFYEKEIYQINSQELKEKMASTQLKVTLVSGGKMKDSPDVFSSVVYEAKENVDAIVTDFTSGHYFVCIGDLCGYVNHIWLDGDSEDLIHLKTVKTKQEKEEFKQKIKNEVAADKEKSEAEKQKQEEKKQQLIVEVAKKYGHNKAEKLVNGIIWVGCTKEMVELSWGKPQDVNTTVTAYSKREQWVYGIGSYVYFEDGKVTVIQN